MTTLEEMAGLLRAASRQAARIAEQETNVYLNGLRAVRRSGRMVGKGATTRPERRRDNALARIETLPPLERLAEPAALAPLLDVIESEDGLTDQQRARLVEIFNAAFSREMQRILSGGEVR